MKLEFKKGSRRARLLETTTLFGHVIRAGFVFNGANISVWAVPLVWLTRWHYKVRDPACLHDWYFYHADTIGNLSEARALYRKGNRKFRAALRKDGCNAYQVAVLYFAVCIGAEWRLLKKRLRKGKGSSG